MSNDQHEVREPAYESVEEHDLERAYDAWREEQEEIANAPEYDPDGRIADWEREMGSIAEVAHSYGLFPAFHSVFPRE